jgi:hypothetical protein
LVFFLPPKKTNKQKYIPEKKNIFSCFNNQPKQKQTFNKKTSFLGKNFFFRKKISSHIYAIQQPKKIFTRGILEKLGNISKSTTEISPFCKKFNF